MKRSNGLKFVITVVVLMLGIAVAGSAFAQRGSDFALFDQHGVFHQISRYNEARAVVLFVYGNDDPASVEALPLLRDLRDRYSEDDVIFLLLDANQHDTRASVLAADLEFPVLLDSAQVVARTLAVTTTAESFIINPKSHRILYRGPLDSRIAVAEANPAMPVPYLESALKAILANVDDAAPAVPAVVGMPIVFEYKERFGDRQISYQDEVVPILRRRCTTCHIENGLAPWAMISHRMMQGWSPMVREVLITRRMPPGQIDTQIGEWDDIHDITDDELTTLVHWIDGGARREGDADPLTELEPIDPAWSLGEPDLIVEVPEEAIPATGIVDFKIKRVALDLDEDKWISAVAYNVGDRTVLHSLLVHALDPDVPASDPAAQIAPENAEYISLYVPGRTEEVFAEDSGFLLKADRDLSFKLRYVSSGRETVDRTRIGLYFRDTEPTYAVRNVITLNENFTIPAGVDNHVEEAQTPVFEHDVYVESFAPQTHTRGKSMTISALYPDGTSQLLINVGNYNFNWQMNYRLTERLLLPAGSRLVSETVFDNSPANPHNVDPEAEVRVGITTWDETFSHYVRILERR
ncbi:MAG: redoxin domain-containing protein [Gammaproteobacteria bacterium]|nr:redoxin domain-containing protein [Gammaproteobacteria bacterium]MDP2140351.1 redoxin domain-containing protein [Gammaproteobacteria bacterium]MDP2346132.1 redoxin domain-containing protein [Gammaproteobacteria bacterium]